MTTRKNTPPALPTAVTGVNPEIAKSMTDQELDDVVAQLTDRLIESFKYLGATTVTDAHHQALLVAFRAEQMFRRDNPAKHPLLAQFGEVE